MNLTILNSAKPPEIVAALFLQYYLFPDIDLIVGDNSGLPDIYDSNKRLGIEVVQCEIESDLDIKYLVKTSLDCNGDYDTVMTKAHEKYDKHNYTACNINGKAEGFVSQNFLFRTEFLNEAFYNNLLKKFKKLKEGNYTDIKGDLNLCILNINRACGCSELNFILKCCEKISNNFEIKFNRIFVVFRSSISVIVNCAIDKKIRIDTTIFDKLIIEAKGKIKNNETEI